MHWCKFDFFSIFLFQGEVVDNENDRLIKRIKLENEVCYMLYLTYKIKLCVYMFDCLCVCVSYGWAATPLSLAHPNLVHGLPLSLDIGKLGDRFLPYGLVCGWGGAKKGLTL